MQFSNIESDDLEKFYRSKACKKDLPGIPADMTTKSKKEEW